MDASGKKRGWKPTALKHHVFGVLLNLNPAAPNANTISLFFDGNRASPPMPLPESMKGKVLYPVMSYKNLTLNVNFGPQPAKSLPFVCRMLEDAAQKDVVPLPGPKERATGKTEVLFPIGLPDEGALDWLDQFLQENKQSCYMELSDRSFLDWAQKSGIARNNRTGNDRLWLDTGIRDLDDGAAKRFLQKMMPVLKRGLVIMEVKNNLPRRSGRKR
jgi:hypothetical protein